MDALVTDVHVPSAVSGLRGLGRAGFKVIALGPRRAAAGLWSRYAAARVAEAGDPDDAGALTATVVRLADQNGGPLIVYPGGEKAISALVRDGARSPRVVLPYPATARDGLWALRDKRRLSALAADTGFAVPRSLMEGRARELTGAPVKAPVVVKPARSGGEPGSARIVESQRALSELTATLDPETPLMIQERLQGRLIVLALVIGRSGEVVAAFQQSVLRTWPSKAGAASLAVSVHPDRTLVDRAAGMLAGLGYWGLVQLDIMETARGSVLIDVNPRFYTSLPLALACGVNLPALWHAVATDERVSTPRGYRPGVSYRWLEADLSRAVRGVPGALRRTPRPRTGAMWAADDPVPGALLALRAVSQRVRRRLSA